MPSKKNAKLTLKKSAKKSRLRPILWIGGSGLPSGVTGKRLMALGNPLHWEPASPEAAQSVAKLSPVLVVLGAERMTENTRSLLFTLDELKSTIDMVVFQLRTSEAKQSTPGIDGVFLRNNQLTHQIKIVLSTMEGGRTFKAAGMRAQKRLQKARGDVSRLRDLAVRDDLTCLYNLRFFNRSLETEHQRATRFGRNYSLIFLDLDGLREVNSRRGHLAGGQVLKQVGEFLNGRIRRIDLPARIGGDEFVIICPETAKLAARLVADRLRLGIQRLTDSQGKSLGITASIGVSCFPDDGDRPEDVLQRADRALYEAKALGKNRVCCWGEFAAEANDKSFMGSVHGTGETPTIARKNDDDRDTNGTPKNTVN